MHYTSTLETLESFWNPLSMSSAHEVGALTILYPLVKVSNPGICSLYSTRCLVHSQSIIKHAIKMDYTSALETLDDFLMILSWYSEHQVGVWAILSLWLSLVVPGITHGSQQSALFTLSQLLSMPYRWITRVL